MKRTVTDATQSWVQKFNASAKSPSDIGESRGLVGYFGSGFSHSAALEAGLSKIVIVSSGDLTAHGYPGQFLGFADGHVTFVSRDQMYQVLSVNDDCRRNAGLPVIRTEPWDYAVPSNH